MTDLLTKLRAATGPDRGLDAEIALAMGIPASITIGDGLITEQRHIPRNSPHYSASIDAALSLMPEGWWLSQFAEMRNEQGEFWTWVARIENGSEPIMRVQLAPTAPLAILIAIFEAREAENG